MSTNSDYRLFHCLGGLYTLGIAFSYDGQGRTAQREGNKHYKSDGCLRLCRHVQDVNGLEIRVREAASQERRFAASLDRYFIISLPRPQYQCRSISAMAEIDEECTWNPSAEPVRRAQGPQRPTAGRRTARSDGHSSTTQKATSLRQNRSCQRHSSSRRILSHLGLFAQAGAENQIYTAEE